MVAQTAVRQSNVRRMKDITGSYCFITNVEIVTFIGFCIYTHIYLNILYISEPQLPQEETIHYTETLQGSYNHHSKVNL